MTHQERDHNNAANLLLWALPDDFAEKLPAYIRPTPRSCVLILVQKDTSRVRSDSGN